MTLWIPTEIPKLGHIVIDSLKEGFLEIIKRVGLEVINIFGIKNIKELRDLEKNYKIELSDITILNSLFKIKYMEEALELLEVLENISVYYLREYSITLMLRNILSNDLGKENISLSISVIDNYFKPISSIILENVLLILETILSKKSRESINFYFDYEKLEQYEQLKIIIGGILKLRKKLPLENKIWIRF